jgi:hypothetical protein
MVLDVVVVVNTIKSDITALPFVAWPGAEMLKLKGIVRTTSKAF